MRMTRRGFNSLALTGLLGGAAAGAAPRGAAASAAGFPDRGVRLIVPFAAGGTSDIVGRVLANQLGEDWGHRLIVENRGGGGTVIGTGALARSPADGYSLLLATPDITINPSLRRDLPYETPKDFAPIAVVASYPLMLVAHPSLPAANVKEFVALAKAQPTAFSYASGGSGSTPHLSMELLKSKAGITIAHVPYRGNGPAITDLLAGRVQVMFTGFPPVAGHVAEGRLKVLGSSGQTRMTALPDVPTVAEQGVTGYEVLTWFGLLAPAGTPEPIIARINESLRKALATDAVKTGLSSLSADLTVSTPAAFHKRLVDEIALWSDVIRTSGTKLDSGG